MRTQHRARRHVTGFGSVWVRAVSCYRLTTVYIIVAAVIVALLLLTL